MKLVYGSDLHLEFDSGRHLPVPDDTDAKVLILAGDIVNTPILRSGHLTNPTVIEKFQAMNDMFARVYVIMGNHEHYEGDYAKTEELARNFYKQFDNFVFLEKEGDTFEGVRFFGGTMWTDFHHEDPQLMYSARHTMNDYSVLNSSRKAYDENGFPRPTARLIPEDVLEDHKSFMYKLYEDLDEHGDLPRVVITHHSPSMIALAEMYRQNHTDMNYLYHNTYDNLILDRPAIKAWFHGHTHVRQVKELGTCKIAANARGYQGYEAAARTFKFAEIEIDTTKENTND